MYLFVFTIMSLCYNVACGPCSQAPDLIVIPRSFTNLFNLPLHSKATLKKKFVSCSAGGQNDGHSGGRKFLFFSFFVVIFVRKKHFVNVSYFAAGQETNFFFSGVA